MRSFRCACGTRVYFENDRCLSCGAALAFDPARMEVRNAGAGDRYCAHHANPGTCNWLVTEDDAVFCAACVLNETIPDLVDAHRLRLYSEVEKAKRRLLFTLLCLGLPVEGRRERDDGLAFRILADARLDESDATLAMYGEVTTGHARGEITINLLEADPRLREQMRMAMNEAYRTLLGHFRHESGHYYWQRLVAHGASLARFRSRFGDERRHYQDSLDAYYRDGPPTGWHNEYVVAYAASHPSEDFAECWSHYLHMVDTLQTAADDGVAVGDRRIRDPASDTRPLEETVDDWRELARAMNDLSRSMGFEDAYPFSLTKPVVEKLRFIHELVRAAKP